MSFISVLETIGKDTEIGLEDVIKYVPGIASLAEVLFPTEAPLEVAAANITVIVATMIQNTVLTIEARYAALPAGTETNAQKLSDALAIVEAPAIALLQTIGISADATRITNAVKAVVSIFHLSDASPVAISTGNAVANVITAVSTAVGN